MIAPKFITVFLSVLVGKNYTRQGCRLSPASIHSFGMFLPISGLTLVLKLHSLASFPSKKDSVFSGKCAHAHMCMCKMHHFLVFWYFEVCWYFWLFEAKYTAMYAIFPRHRTDFLCSLFAICNYLHVHICFYC